MDSIVHTILSMSTHTHTGVVWPMAVHNRDERRDKLSISGAFIFADQFVGGRVASRATVGGVGLVRPVPDPYRMCVHRLQLKLTVIKFYEEQASINGQRRKGYL